MVSSDTVRNLIGILGNTISFFLFTSPVPTFVEIWKKKSVQQYSATPYLITLVNCMVWVLYGLPMVHPKSLLVLTISVIGAALELCYVILFIIFSDKKKKRLRLISIVVVEFIFVLVLGVLVFTLAHTTKKRTLIVGSIGTFFSVMMYASPLSVMKMVITTKNVEYMPFSLSIASFASAAVWSFYAFLRFDPFIIISNGLGAVLALAQLILYGMFYKSTKRQIEAKKAEREMCSTEATVNGDSKKPGSGVV